MSKAPLRPYTVNIRKRAEKTLARLFSADRTQFDRLDGFIQNTLPVNPRAQGVEKLKGTTNDYRYRAGDYRLLFSINDRTRLVIVEDVDNRKDVYRK